MKQEQARGNPNAVVSEAGGVRPRAGHAAPGTAGVGAGGWVAAVLCSAGTKLGYCFCAGKTLCFGKGQWSRRVCHRLAEAPEAWGSGLLMWGLL